MARSRLPLAGCHVLVVEDQYLVADQMMRTVRELGGQVVGPAPNAQVALDLMARGHVDLAILDVNLGGGDVYPVAAELKRRNISYLFATGYEKWVIPDDYQGVPHLEKPVTVRALEDAVGRVSLGR